MTDNTDMSTPIDLSDADHPLTDVREYVRLTPTEAAVSPSHVTSNVADLHGFGQQDSGLFGWGRGDQPTIEMLLAAHGSPPQRRIDYLFGIDEPDRLPDLKETVRGWFPHSYETTTAERSLVDALGLREAAAASLTDGSTTGESTQATRPDVTPLCEYSIGGLELFAVSDEADAWQFGVTPFDSFYDGDRGRYPLTGVVDAMRNTDVPILLQTVIQPMEDWSAARADRVDELSRDDASEQGRSPMVEGFWRAFGRPTSAGRRADRHRERDDRSPAPPTPRDEQRIEALTAVEPATSFTVNTRGVAFGTDDDAVAAAVESLQPRFRKIGQAPYNVSARTYAPGSKQAADLCERVAARDVTGRHAWPWWLRRQLPGFTALSPAIVTDSRTLPTLIVLGGASLTPGGQRALSTVPTTRRSIRLPNPGELEPFLGDGFFLGYPVTADREMWDEGLALPPSLQLLHTVIFAATGHGKTILMVNGVRTNVAVTDGAHVLILPKGGETADRYMRAHYADHGTLENVYYFDCADVLPAISFFDIQPALDAGFDRSTIVHQRIQAFLDISRLTMPGDTFERAQRSLEVLYWLLVSMYDRTFGGNAFSLGDLLDQVHRLQENGEPPPVEDSFLRELLQGLEYEGGQVSDAVIEGVKTRVHKVVEHEGVATVFNYTPTATDPQFEFSDFLDEDVVLLFDTGDLSDTAQDVLSIVLCSKLWRAVRQRTKVYESRVDTPPVVNLVVEEAKDVAVADVFKQFLTQGREFGLATLLSMQRPGQLKAESEDAYEELKTEVQTVLAGHQKASRDVAEWFATDGDVARAQDLLSGLSPGEWLTLLPQEYGRPRPPRFKLRSGDLPPGYAPETDAPNSKQFTEIQEHAYQSSLAQVTATTKREYGIENTSFLDEAPDATHPVTSIDDVTVAPGGDTRADPPDDQTDAAPSQDGAASSQDGADPDRRTGAVAESATVPDAAPSTSPGHTPRDASTPGAGTSADEGSDERVADDGSAGPQGPPDDGPVTDERAADVERDESVADDGAADEAADQTGIHSVLPYTERMPSMVNLSDDERYLECHFCEDRFDRSIKGMRKAIECHGSLTEVDRENVPVCEITVKLDPPEQAEIPLSDGQLAFLQMVYDAKQFKFTDLEFNPLVDSCLLLRQYAGIKQPETAELCDKGLVRRETNHPHLMYSLTPRGRDLIGESHRHGIDFGDGKGDLDETMQHRVAVKVTARYLEETYVASPESDAVEVKRYHEIETGRLDAAALGPEGDVLVAAEAERTANHDTRKAVPADYDKMAACDPEEAIWVVMSQSGGHKVMDALADPADGSPRVDKTYAERTPPRRFHIDQPGCSQMYSLTHLRNQKVDDLSLDETATHR